MLNGRALFIKSCANHSGKAADLLFAMPSQIAGRFDACGQLELVCACLADLNLISFFIELFDIQSTTIRIYEMFEILQRQKKTLCNPKRCRGFCDGIISILLLFLPDKEEY